MERLAPATETGTERPQGAQERAESLPPKVEVAAETPQTKATQAAKEDTDPSGKQEASGQGVARAEPRTSLEQAAAESSPNEPLQGQTPTPVQGEQGRQEQPPQPEQRSQGKQGKAQGQGQKQRQRQGQADTRLTKVFVGGLAWHTTRETLASFFSRFGEVEDSVVIVDRQTGRSRGYGFVTFKEASAAERACVNGNPCIDNRTANCNLASLGLKHSPPHQQQLPCRFQGAGAGATGGWGRGRGGGRGGQRLQYAPQHPFQAGGASPRGFGGRPGSQGAPPGGFMPFHVAYHQQQQITNPLTQQQQPLYGMHPLGPAQAGQGYAYGQAGQGYAYGQPFGVAGLPLMDAHGFPFSPQGQGVYGGYLAGATQGVPMAGYSSTQPPTAPSALAPRPVPPGEAQGGNMMGGGAARGVPMAVYAPAPGARAPSSLIPQMEHAGTQVGGVMPAPYVPGYLSEGIPQPGLPVVYPPVPSTGPPTPAAAAAAATAATGGAPAVRPQKAVLLASALPPHLQKQQQQQPWAEAVATGSATAAPPQADMPHATTSATPPDSRDAAPGSSDASGARPDAPEGESGGPARSPGVASQGPTLPAQAEAMAPQGLDKALAMQERQPP